MGQWLQLKPGKTAILRVGLLCLFCLPSAWASSAASVDSVPVNLQLQTLLEPQINNAFIAETATTADLAPQTVAHFYQQRQWTPIWDDTRYTALLAQIRNLESDGLNPRDYLLAELEKCLPAKSACAQSAEREMLATRAYLLALKHLYRGQVNPAQLDPDWNFDMPMINGEEGLKHAREAVENNNLPALFQRARPALPRYERMRKALAELRQQAAKGGWPQLPVKLPGGKKSLKPGSTDELVILLRQRLQVAGLLDNTSSTSADANARLTSHENTLGNSSTSTNTDPAYYDSTLENAVRRYQQSAYMVADGVVGKQTIEHLNVPIEQRIGQLRVNLERMRWHLRNISGDYVIVDVAGYNIAYIRDGKRIWQSRVQVGRSYRKTPIFQSLITRITFNPQWTIPPTIMKKDSLPAIRKNRNYLTKNHIRVLDKDGNRISPNSVNWYNPGNIMLRQDAGPEGSLGQIAIRFPNPYSVYLHETPHQELFKVDQRNFSSGCIRVENVRELAVLLFNDEVLWNREALELALTDLKTREMNLSRKIPILIDYWTVDIDDDGYISWRPDAYGKDNDVLAALDGLPVTPHKQEQEPL